MRVVSAWSVSAAMRRDLGLDFDREASDALFDLNEHARFH